MEQRPHSLWKSLRDRLKIATHPKGAKRTVAALLNVTPAAVSQWLSGATNPNAESTLMLLNWVEREGATKTKRGDHAATRSPQKTRRTESKSNEKHPSSRKTR